MRARASVLVVDDDVGMCETLSDILGHEGYKVVTTGKGTEALALVKKEPFVICLVDMKLPDIDGVKVLQGIKNLSTDSYVIMITAFATLQNSIEALNKGAYAYILKPLEMDELKAVIKRAVENYELVRTKRKLERELKESEEKYRSLAEKSPNMIFINKGGRIVYVNKRCEEMVGYTGEEFYSKDFDFMTLIAPEFRDLVKENLRKHMKGEEIPPYDYKLLTKDGREIIAILTTKLIDFEGEKAIMGIITDITERKGAEKALRESEVKYRSLFDDALDMIHIVVYGKIVDANKIELETMGYSKEEYLGKSISEMTHPDYRIATKNVMERVLKGEVVRNYETALVTKKGEKVMVAVNVVPLIEDGKPVGARAILRDITERKKLERLLKEYSERLEEKVEGRTKEVTEAKDFLNSVIESSADAITTSDLDGKITSFSKGAEDLLGYKAEDVIGTHVLDLYPPESKKREDRIQRAKQLREYGAIRNIRMRIYNARGKLLDINLSLSLLKDGEGKTIGTVGVAKDITRVLKAEQKLKESLDELFLLQEINNALNSGMSLDEILQIITDGITSVFDYDSCAVNLLDEGGTHLICRSYSMDSKIIEKIEKLSGLTALNYTIPLHEGSSLTKVVKTGEPFITNDIVGLIKSHTDKKHVKALAKTAARIFGTKSGMGVPLLAGDRVIGVIGVGSKKQLSSKDAERLLVFGGQAGLAIEKAKMYERLESAYDKLKELDRIKTDIISNVSHELRTPITIISASLGLLKDEEDVGRRKKILKMAANALSRQNLVVEDLITAASFKRKVIELNLEPVDISSVITRVCRKSNSVAKEKGVEMSFKTDENIPTVKADFKKLEHILRNLVHNAVKFSKKEGGEVLIEAKEKDGMIEVSVSDKGVGIPEDKLEHIFEPLYQVDSSASRFFAGTGMGLVVAKELVEAHGGSIWVESEPEEWTRFTFTLPVGAGR